MRDIGELDFAAVDRLVFPLTGPEVRHDDENQVEQELGLGDEDVPYLNPVAVGEWVWNRADARSVDALFKSNLSQGGLT